METPFVHLHCHSHYSLLDGAGKIADLLKRAKDLGMPALAITDHGNLYGALEFYTTAKKFEIKPILGYEAYIATGSLRDKTGKTQKESCYHLTLLAMNRTGFDNLIKMATIANLEGFHYKPRIDKELLAEKNEGIICLSGCASSEMSRILSEQKPDSLERAKKVAEWYRDIFGDRFYIELQDNFLELQKPILEGSIQIARELGIAAAATNDVHYIYPKDAKTQEVLLCVNSKKTLNDSNRMRFETDQFYMRSGQEMLKAMPNQEDAIARTLEIAERCCVDYQLRDYKYPVFIPPDNLSAEDYLRQLCLEGLKRRYAGNEKRCPNGELSGEVTDRLNRELDVINKKNYASYFLIVGDYVRAAEERGIQHTARGSGVGAIVCYALNMSHVCPLEFDLLFERFLDESRTEPPDIDIDFDQDRRDEIFDYIKQKYGEDKVAQLGTFGTLAAKASIKAVGRVLDLPLAYVNEISNLVPGTPGITLEKALAESEELNKRYTNENDVKELLDYALSIEGLVNNTGVHACGTVIADKTLSEYVPLQRSKEGSTVTQWEGPIVESAGLLKMDILGLQNLSVLENAINVIKETTGETIDPYKYPLDDAETFQLFQRGETKGVFQFESGGIRELLTRLRPDNFRDIIAANALYRPGPLEGGLVDKYINVKHGREKAVYEHPILEEVLKETNGVMVYQEQIMRILNRLGQIPLGGAYTCIKYISKKKDFSKFREQFVAGSVENGLAKEKADEVFELIIKFAGYGFNKSHSTAYALVAYMTAYLKVHYPKQFMAALLCGDIRKGMGSVAEHIEDCNRMNIEVIPPDINKSKPHFTVVDDKIAYALSAISGCGERAMKAIVAERESNGLYTSVFNLCERNECSKTALENLIKAGAFDSVNPNRAALYSQIEDALKVGRKAASDAAQGQMGLFGGSDDWDEKKDKTKNNDAETSHSDNSLKIKDWTDKEKAEYEKAVLGFCLTIKLLNEHEPIFKMLRTASIVQAAALPSDTQVTLAGTVGAIKNGQPKNAKKDKPSVWAMFDFEDESGSIRTITWGEQYAVYQDKIKAGDVVIIRGRIDRSRSESNDSADGNLIVDEVYTIQEAPTELARGLKITLDEKTHSPETVDRLAQLFVDSQQQNQPTQQTPIELTIKLSNGSTAVMQGAKSSAMITPELKHKVDELIGTHFVNVLCKPYKKREQKQPWNNRQRS